MNDKHDDILVGIVIGSAIGTVIAWLWAIHTYTKLGG